MSIVEVLIDWFYFVKMVNNNKKKHKMKPKCICNEINICWMLIHIKSFYEIRCCSFVCVFVISFNLRRMTECVGRRFIFLSSVRLVCVCVWVVIFFSFVVVILSVDKEKEQIGVFEGGFFGWLMMITKMDMGLIMMDNNLWGN